jgi:hypothetical protein
VWEIGLQRYTQGLFSPLGEWDLGWMDGLLLCLGSFYSGWPFRACVVHLYFCDDGYESYEIGRSWRWPRRCVSIVVSSSFVYRRLKYEVLCVLTDLGLLAVFVELKHRVDEGLDAADGVPDMAKSDGGRWCDACGRAERVQ